MEIQNQTTLEEQRYRMVVEESGIALRDYDEITGIDYMNDCFRQYELSRIAAQQLKEMPRKDIISVIDEDRPLWRDFTRQVADQGRGMIAPVRLKMMDGTFRWSELHAIEIRDGEGKLSRKICFIRDIDEVTRRNQELQKRYDTEMMRLRSFGNGVVERLSIDLTENRVIEAVTPDTEYRSELIGRRMEDLLNMRLAVTGIQEDRENLRRFFDREALLRAFDLGERPCMQIALPNGKEYTSYKITAQCLKAPESGHIFAFIKVRDNDTERVRETVMRTALENNYESFLIVNADTGTIKVGFTKGDEALTTNLDQVYDELARQDIFHAVPEEEQQQIMREMSLDSLRNKLLDVPQCSGKVTRLVQGTPAYRMWTASYFGKNKKYILIMISDITNVYKKDMEHARRLQDALHAAKQANEAKTNFLSNMSHEIRTPMNAILGMTRLAADEVAGIPAARGYIRQIEQSSQYLLGILNDILEMSRIESGKTKLEYSWHTPEEVTSPVVHMMEPLMEKKGIRFRYPRSVLRRWNIESYVDIQKTQQMLMNLLNNAYKFTPPGGTVSIRFRNIALDTEKKICTDALIVEDTGCGMSQEFMKRIFQPFEQEHGSDKDGTTGTGLGLAISRSFAKMMGGDITVQSEQGKGSVFTIHYTYQYRELDGQSSSGTTEQKSESPDIRGTRILLAEDNALNAMIARKLLEKAGAVIDWMQDGKKAVEAFCASKEGDYDFILMDVRMPQMDGLEAARQIRACGRADAKTIPIVAMSANAYEEDRQRSLDAGMNDHLPKPVEPEHLYQTIAKYLHAAASCADRECADRERAGREEQ